MTPVAPLDSSEGERVRYGASANVPSRLEETPVGVATVVLVATDWPDDLARALAGLADHAPEGTSIVIVADAPSEEQAARPRGGRGGRRDGRPVDRDRVDERPPGQGAALNAGVRRAPGPVVILLDSSVEPTGDFVTPLTAALDDPAVALAGGWGIVSDDLRRFEDAPPGDVDAIEAYCLAFRREDFATRGPFDERFRFYRNLDIWWSLVLRDEGEGTAPRRGVALADLPLTRHEHRGYTSLPPDERDRQSKRNFYRIIDRFGSRRDLLVRSGDEHAR